MQRHASVYGSRRRMPYPIEVNSNIEGPSVSRTRRKLGYETRYDFRVGTEDYIKMYREP